MKIESVCFTDETESYEKLIHALTHSINELPDEKKAPVAEEVIARENIASTFVASGVALPHCRTGEVSNIFTAVGILKKPAMFGIDRDKETVVVFLIVSPADNPKNHLRHIAKVAKLVKIKEFIDQLKNCKTTEEVHSTIQKYSDD